MFDSLFYGFIIWSTVLAYCEKFDFGQSSCYSQPVLLIDNRRRVQLGEMPAYWKLKTKCFCVARAATDQVYASIVVSKASQSNGTIPVSFQGQPFFTLLGVGEEATEKLAISQVKVI